METSKWVRPSQSRAARALLGLSAKEFSDLSGASPSTMDRYETADGTPSVSLEKAVDIRQGFEAYGIEFVEDGERFGVLASADSAGLARKALADHASAKGSMGRSSAGVIAALMMLAATGWGVATFQHAGMGAGVAAGSGAPQTAALERTAQPGATDDALPAAPLPTLPTPASLPSAPALAPTPRPDTAVPQPACPPGFPCGLMIRPVSASTDRVDALKDEIKMAELEAAITKLGGSLGTGMPAKPVAEMDRFERHDRIQLLKDAFTITELEAELARNGVPTVAEDSRRAMEMTILDRKVRIKHLKEELDVALLRKQLQEIRQATNATPDKAEIPGQPFSGLARFAVPDNPTINLLRTPIHHPDAPAKTTASKAKPGKRLPQAFRVSLVEKDGDGRILFEAHDTARANKTLPVRQITQIPYVTSVSVNLQTGKETRKTTTLDAGVSASVIVKPMDDGQLEVQFAYDHTTLIRWNDLPAGDITIRAPVKNTISHMTKVVVRPGEPIVYHGSHSDGEKTEERVVVLTVDPAG